MLKSDLRRLLAVWPEWEILEVAPWRPMVLIANTAQGKRPWEQEEGGRVSDTDYQGGKERAEERREGWRGGALLPTSCPDQTGQPSRIRWKHLPLGALYLRPPEVGRGSRWEKAPPKDASPTLLEALSTF